MTKTVPLLITTIILAATSLALAEPAPLTLWYDSPAQDWQSQALPIGNGRLGAMVFGGVDEERIQLNVDSLWTGDENVSGGYGTMGAYQTLGDVSIELEGKSAAEEYRRQLDLSRAIHRVRYTKDGVKFTREMFCSHPDQVVVARLTADRPKQYSGTIRLKDGHQAATESDGSRLVVAGALSNGLRYETQLHVAASGGTVVADGDAIRFVQCDEVTIVVAAGTDYVMDYQKQWRGEDPHRQVAAQLAAAVKEDYAELLRRHVEDYRSLFDRVALDVGQTPAQRAELPTNRRLEAYREDPADPDLEETLFQYGRYLLIGSSRPGCLPANLQGLWNNSNQPPWNSDYHTNINVQMNYWPAEPANLAECHEPLIGLIDAFREPSRQATRAAFGEVRGFTFRTSHNIYGGHGWKWNTPASAWYCQHVWEHYAFGRDKQYLRDTAYPILKEVAQFWEDHLKELPDGTLVAPNGWSPEHGPEEDGVSYDQQIVWDLFANYLEAAEVLDIDRPYRDRVADLRRRLLGPKIGKWGQLQEWVEDRDDPNDRHRHTSHLFAVYPGRQISVAQTPELAQAAEVSLKARGETGDSRRSWTWPWRCGIWARLQNGEMAHHMIEGLLTYNILPNLLGNHPPLQLDGSFGITAGICEMLVQSHAGEIHLLPALPKAWPNGSAQGLRARGGLEVEITWKDGRATSAKLKATVAGRHKIRPPKDQQIVGPEVIELEAGNVHEIRFK